MTMFTAAEKAATSTPMARKYLRSGSLPSDRKLPRRSPTHTDAFAGVWEEYETYSFQMNCRGAFNTGRRIPESGAAD